LTTSSIPANKSFIEKLEFFLPRLFILLATFVALYSPQIEQIRTFSIIFLSILFEALPFMLIGSFAGGLIEEFVSREKVIEILPEKSKRAVFMAAAIGFLFPVCECAIVPVVRRLLRKGVPFSAAIAYLLAGPIVNPLVAASTAVAYFYDWKVVFLRIGLGYFIAVFVGLLMDKLIPEDERLAKKLMDSASQKAKASKSDDSGCSGAHKHDHEHDCNHNHDHEHGHDHKTCTHEHAHEAESSGCACGHNHSHNDEGKKAGVFARLHRALIHGADDFLEVACFLVVGAFFAALVQTFLDRQTVIGIMGENWIAILVMMLLAVLLNLCSEADAFIAASFKNLVPFSGQLGFLVLGPMFDIKLFFMYFSIFSRKTAIRLAIATCVITFIVVYLTSVLLNGGFV
jgi:uncharacterized membrane protein YraQ (UPF0718 family)